MDSRVFESLKPSDMKMSEALLLGSTYPGYMWSNAQCCRVGQMLQVFGLNKDEYGPTRVFMHQWGEVIGKLWPWTLQYDHRNHVNVVGEVVVEYLNSLVNHKSVGHTLSTLSGCHRKTIHDLVSLVEKLESIYCPSTPQQETLDVTNTI